MVAAGAFGTKFQHDHRGTKCRECLDELHPVLDRREKLGLGLGEQQDISGRKRPFALLARNELNIRAGIEKIGTPAARAVAKAANTSSGVKRSRRV